MTPATAAPTARHASTRQSRTFEGEGLYEAREQHNDLGTGRGSRAGAAKDTADTDKATRWLEEHGEPPAPRVVRRLVRPAHAPMADVLERDDARRSSQRDAADYARDHLPVAKERLDLYNEASEHPWVRWALAVAGERKAIDVELAAGFRSPRTVNTVELRGCPLTLDVVALVANALGPNPLFPIELANALTSLSVEVHRARGSLDVRHVLRTLGLNFPEPMSDRVVDNLARMISFGRGGGRPSKLEGQKLSLAGLGRILAQPAEWEEAGLLSRFVEGDFAPKETPDAGRVETSLGKRLLQRGDLNGMSAVEVHQLAADYWPDSAWRVEIVLVDPNPTKPGQRNHYPLADGKEPGSYVSPTRPNYKAITADVARRIDKLKGEIAEVEARQPPDEADEALLHELEASLRAARRRKVEAVALEARGQKKKPYKRPTMRPLKACRSWGFPDPKREAEKKIAGKNGPIASFPHVWVGGEHATFTADPPPYPSAHAATSPP